MKEPSGAEGHDRFVRPRKRRLANLWLSNAVLEESRVSRPKRQEDAIFLRPYTPSQLRLDWPTEEEFDDLVGQSSSASCNGESSECGSSKATYGSLFPPYEPSPRGPSSRFRRQLPPPAFKDGFDSYVPRQLWTLGDVRVTVLRRFLGVTRLCFWTWKRDAIRRRPLVRRAQAIQDRGRLKHAMWQYRRRYRIDKHVGIRVTWFNHLTKVKGGAEVGLRGRKQEPQAAAGSSMR